MNKAGIFFGIIWIALALFLSVVLAKGLTGKNTNIFRGTENFMDEIEKEKNLEDERIFDAVALDKISVSLASASVYYIESPDSKIHVKLLGRWNSSEIPSISCNNGSLYVKSPRVKLFFHFWQIQKKQVEILIPANCINKNTEIKNECASGSTHIRALQPGTIKLESASGSIHLDDCVAQSISISAASGSININDCEFDILKSEAASGSFHANGKFNQLKIECASGSINIENNIPLKEDSSIEAVSGSIRLKIPEDSDYRVKYESMSGSFKDEITGNSGGRTGTERNGSGDVEIKLSTVSGSIRILK